MRRIRKKSIGLRLFDGVRKVIFFLVIFVVVIGLVIGGGIFGYVSSLTASHPPSTKAEFAADFQQNSIPNSYVRPVGEPLLPTDKIVVTSLNQVSPVLIDAILSTEDRGFYQESGFSVKAMGRSVLEFIQSTFLFEDVAQTGGSTIDQQVVKNVVIDNDDKTLSRKAIEIVNAYRMDQYFSKDDILINYLNCIPFSTGRDGRQVYGVWAQSKNLFNKNPDQLTIPEAAYLAGMIHAPSSDNPYAGTAQLQLGIARMKQVLGFMLANNKITNQQYQQYLQYDITKDFVKTY